MMHIFNLKTGLLKVEMLIKGKYPFKLIGKVNFCYSCKLITT